MFTDNAVPDAVMTPAHANGHATVPAAAVPEYDPACKPVPPSLVLISAVGPWLVRVDPARDRITLEGHGTPASVFPASTNRPACSCREWATNRPCGRSCLHVRLLQAVGLVPTLPKNGRAG